MNCSGKDKKHKKVVVSFNINNIINYVILC